MGPVTGSTTSTPFLHSALCHCLLPDIRGPISVQFTITRDIVRDLSALVGELNAMRADAIHWLEGPEYGPLRLRQR
jgi:hypothetical protein